MFSDDAKKLDKLLNVDTSSDVEDSEVLPDPSILEKELEEEVENATYQHKQSAKAVILNIAALYITEDFVERHPYIETKIERDIISYSQLQFQMYAYEKAIAKMMRQMAVESETHPRFFEVYSNMLSAKSKLTVTMSEYLVAMEETYKKLRQDIDIFGSEIVEIGDDKKDGDGLEYRGNKKLLEDVREELPSDKFDEIVYDEPRNPQLETNSGNNLPEDVKDPNKKKTNEEEIDKNVEEVNNYFDDNEAWG